MQRSRAAFSTGFTLGSAPSAANPHSSRLESFAFAPIETPFGFFCAGVDFQPAAAVQVRSFNISMLGGPVMAEFVVRVLGS